jgi:hypothetical protein
VRNWYVDSFKELRRFPAVKDTADELHFTELLKHIYHRHRCAARRRLLDGRPIARLPQRVLKNTLFLVSLKACQQQQGRRCVWRLSARFSPLHE